MKYWVRVVRPMVFWLVFVAILFGIHKHRELMEKTRIRFAVSLEGRPVYEGSATLDGVSVQAGQKISLGRHRLVIVSPKAVVFESNMFVWYGGWDLGQIDLERSRGSLRIGASPAAMQIAIRGPEFSVVLTNSSGMTSSVPTDLYTVEARYKRWSKTENVSVSSGVGGMLNIEPRLGALHVVSTHQRTYFELRNDAGELVEAGELPVTITELVEQNYSLVSRRVNESREARLYVKAGLTNDFRVEFTYGSAVIESEPSNAQVLSSDTGVLGVTPLMLSDLQPGRWRYTLQKPGYEPVSFSVAVVGNETNFFRTNLVNSEYFRAMASAREFYAQENFVNALTELDQALQAQPNDKAAADLKRDASGKRHIQAAKEFGRRGDYTAAMRELQATLEFLPDSEEAKALNVEYATRMDEADKEMARKAREASAEKARQERSDRANAYFSEWMKSVPNQGLFVQNIEKLNGSVSEFEKKFVNALTNGQSTFQLMDLKHPKSEMFSLRVKQDLGITGWRRCDLAACQSSDGEVTVVFKVFEYAYKEAFSLRAVVGDNDENSMVPIHATRIDPSKRSLLSRRTEGVEMFRGIIQVSH